MLAQDFRRLATPERAKSVAILAALGLVLMPALADAKPKYPGDFTSDAKLTALEKKVGAKVVPIERPEALAGTKAKLAKAASGQGQVRILHLGDSHIASDYITGRIRHRLQKAFGDGGRGFTHVAQLWGYGGRRLTKAKGWASDRIVDKDRAGRPFGFSGMSLESTKKGAKLKYRIESDETEVRVYYYQQPGGGSLAASVGGKALGSVSTAGEIASKVWTIDLSGAPAKTVKMKGPAGGRILELVAEAPKARVFGLSFETKKPGVVYESIGPVGADAKVYLELGRDSFEQHLSAHAPDVVVLMVGGNDALKIRKKWTDPARVEKDHQQLIDLLKKIVPGVQIILWAPMDAGDKKGKKVVSKGFLTEVRAMQKRVAGEKQIAYWDTLDAMGGPGAITRWHAAKVMNKDLVHPKKRAADLLGELFADAFTRAMK